MNHYIYNGPVTSFGKPIANYWQASALAATEKKARRNMIYQFKKQNNLVVGSKISLPGTIYAIDFGIGGQKWGERLYQNKDGSLTPLGKLRYGSKGERLNKYRQKNGSSSKKKTNNNKIDKTKIEQKPKSVSEMSDDELNKKIERMRLEDTYNELSAKRIPPDI